jgi:hypothetical protein
MDAKPWICIHPKKEYDTTTVDQETIYTPTTIKKSADIFNASVLESSSSFRIPGINMPRRMT